MSQRRPDARLFALVSGVTAAGCSALAVAALQLATAGLSVGAALAIAVLAAAAMAAELFPIPLDRDDRGVTLTFVFGLAALVLIGWQAAALVLVGPAVAAQLRERRPPRRIAYNAGVGGLAAAAGGAATSHLPRADAAETALVVAVGAVSVYVVTAVLVAAALAASSRRSLVATLAAAVTGTALPFGLMASAALALVMLWRDTPTLALALAGPLLAIALYQRSASRALGAMQLALTDPLTGLGNQRHFRERLQLELRRADACARPVSVCLIDIDDFKGVNDRHGHSAGDCLLVQVAARLRHGGESFRLGGDEFAVLLPGTGAPAATSAAEAVIERIRTLPAEHGSPVTASGGVATFPTRGLARDDLLRVADAALYRAKEQGKNRVQAHEPDPAALALFRHAASGDDRAARFDAALGLARAIDQRDVFGRGHSERVADLVGRLALRLRLDEADVELARLAGSLHDLGKLAIPQELLRKRGPLSEDDRVALERHPQLGHRMLASLDLQPVASWVRHHHERWDGTGYPDGLRGDEIPLPARIIGVADAFDAMTAADGYREPLAELAALDELERCAGTQFDANVVAALAAEVGAARERRPAAALAV